MKENFKSGFTAIIGRPNVGKSTLMNHLIGQKIAITSKKPQTTRNRIQTVYTCEDGQIVFLDTPGIHKAKNKLGEYMVQVAERTLKDVDVILWLVEPTTFIGAGERHIAEQLKGLHLPVILVINKVDTVDKDEILKMVNALESKSTHPVATAIHQYVGEIDHSIKLENVEEIAGHGLKAIVNGKELLVGNFKLMDKFNIVYDLDPSTIVYTLIAIAYDGKFAGYITIADSIKEDAQIAIDKLKALGVKTTMLSGDKSTVVKFVADKLGITNAFGDLLPEDKVNKVKEIKTENETVAFVGDGVNDAPVVALSDVGIAMGGLGSDATIETANVVIQDDKPSKIPMAINIGKQTKKIVWQNITLAFVVKGIVLVLGAGGLATMWEAVFADVGVALLAILNAVRIQRMKF